MTRTIGRVWCATLGCDKNLVDSEALLGRFAAQGFELADRAEQADVWVLNTCGFIAAARADSLAALRELARSKPARQQLVVTGCWAQEHAAEIRKRFPEVDLVAGVGEFDRIVAAVGDRKSGLVVVEPERARYGGFARRPLLTPGHLANVKISEGCSRHCTFCRIPSLRGPLRSRPSGDIVEEVRTLVAAGVSEIQIVSQNTSDYGRDSGEDLLGLVARLNEVDGLRWIRLLYLYAGLLPAETALRLLALPKVVPYLDVPIQHASEPLLRAMKRPGDAVATERFFALLRREHPDVVLRTTVMLGFPGEREEDIERLCDLMATVEFDHLGTYRYSPEDGTPAAALPKAVPAEEVVDREARIVDLQAEISLRRQSGRLGRRYDMVIDEVIPPGARPELLASFQDGLWREKAERMRAAAVMESQRRLVIGRSHHYGYDLDGVVVAPSERACAGDWVRAIFTGVTAFDAWSEIDASKQKGSRE